LFDILFQPRIPLKLITRRSILLGAINQGLLRMHRGHRHRQLPL
jgi:hypothetical protein